MRDFTFSSRFLSSEECEEWVIHAGPTFRAAVSERRVGHGLPIICGSPKGTVRSLQKWEHGTMIEEVITTNKEDNSSYLRPERGRDGFWGRGLGAWGRGRSQEAAQ